MATAVNQANFDEVVLKSTLPVLVDFWAEWCGPCRMVSPVVDAISAARADTLNVVKVNVDENPDLAAKYGIMSIPSLLLFKDGEVVAQRVGYQAKEALETMIDQGK